MLRLVDTHLEDGKLSCFVYIRKGFLYFEFFFLQIKRKESYEGLLDFLEIVFGFRVDRYPGVMEEAHRKSRDCGLFKGCHKVNIASWAPLFMVNIGDFVKAGWDGPVGVVKRLVEGEQSPAYVALFCAPEGVFEVTVALSFPGPGRMLVTPADSTSARTFYERAERTAREMLGDGTHLNWGGTPVSRETFARYAGYLGELAAMAETGRSLLWTPIQKEVENLRLNIL